MKIEKTKYKELAESVDIASIDLCELLVKDIKKDMAIQSQSIEIEHKSKMTKYKLENEKLKVFIETSIQGLSEEIKEENKRVFYLEFTYCIEYNVEDSFRFEDIYYELFAMKNAPVNLWPYMRELIHSLSIRMGIPEIIIPPYVS
ncbi:hypothetical protein [Intestinibacter bartlettii]|uniref:hypothetical protein n=1 Tax=Intestinibacter bartlettii TaxID=261299 RepID=UPI0028FFC578|nr:hypothetical protein [Intestinibacter bartlettii]MDU2163094.1 hypothetical protein [Intestinibacter bartlettii]